MKSTYTGFTDGLLSTFNKFIDQPISMYSGATDINIPIYEINDGKINVPISLKYHSSGIKVEEEASCVGLGWILDVGGVIIQNVVGDYDQEDQNYEEFINSSIFNQIDTSFTRGLIKLAALPKTEYYNKMDCIIYEHEACTQKAGKLNPDVFSYKFADYCGKFIIDPKSDSIYFFNKSENFNIEYLPKSNTEQFEGSYIYGFKITTNEGISYYFKSPLVTKNVEISTICFLLTKVEWPNGTFISYEYETFSTTKYNCNEYALGPLYNINEQSNYYFKLYRSKDAFKTYINKFTSKEFIIKSITTPNYIVDFHASERVDFENGKKIDSLTIKAKHTNTYKSFHFKYDYFSNPYSEDNKCWNLHFWPKSSNYASKRLKLLSLQEAGSNPYIFLYSNIKLPRKDSYATDYWGYFNGVLSNQSFLPKLTFLYNHNFTQNKFDYLVTQNKEYNNESDLADRRANPYFTKALILEKLIYPTGGSTSLNYELNTFSKIGCKVSPLEKKQYPGAVRLEEHDYYVQGFSDIEKFNHEITAYDHNIVSINEKEKNIAISENIQASLSIIINKGDGKKWNDILKPYLEYVEIFKLDEFNKCILSVRADQFNNQEIENEQVLEINIDLTQGKYKLITEFPDFEDQYAGGYIKAKLNFCYKEPKSIFSSGAGLRVQSTIQESDNNIIKKEYNYHDSHSGKSNGKLFYPPINYKIFNCFYEWKRGGPMEIGEHHEYVTMSEYFGNSLVKSPYSSTALVGYDSVVVKYTNQNNGYEVLNYINEPGSFFHYGILSIPPLNGYLNKKTTYDKHHKIIYQETNNFTFQKSKVFRGVNVNYRHNYKFDQYMDGYDYIPLSSFDHSVNGAYLGDDLIDAYIHEFYSHEIYKDSTNYIKKGAKHTIIYEYVPSYLQIKNHIYKYQSNTIKKEYIYPYDCLCSTCKLRLQKNLINVPCEERIFKNNSIISKKRIIMAVFNDKVLESKYYISDNIKNTGFTNTYSCDYIDNKVFPKIETQYLNYDMFGNINYLIDEKLTHTVYLWSYKGQYLISIIRNATYNEINNLINTYFGVADINALSLQDYIDEKALISFNKEINNKYIGECALYIPLIGISKHISNRNIITEYEYDKYNRLINSNINIDNNANKRYKVNKIEYNYRKQKFSSSKEQMN